MAINPQCPAFVDPPSVYAPIAEWVSYRDSLVASGLPGVEVFVAEATDAIAARQGNDPPGFLANRRPVSRAPRTLQKHGKHVAGDPVTTKHPRDEGLRAHLPQIVGKARVFRRRTTIAMRHPPPVTITRRRPTSPVPVRQIAERTAQHQLPTNPNR
jgi:hypothetical protein